jgi:hypothetical protein
LTERAIAPINELRWKGMTANEGAVLGAGEVLYAQNFFVRDGILEGRRGVVQLGSTLGGAIQGMKFWRTLDGVPRLSAVANARYYEYNFSSFDFVEMSNLGATGFQADKPVRFAVSRGRLLFCQKHDSLRPRMVTRAVDDSPVFTTLSNAPAGAGNVAVYYDKVFFYDIIDNPSVFEWSEEGQPTEGYFGEGFDWEFVQTDASRIYTMVPLNNRMMVQKRTTSAVIYGEVDDNFRTDAVREGVSETEGSVAPLGSVVADGDVYFVSDGGPRVAANGEAVGKIDEAPAQHGGFANRLRDVWLRLNRAAEENIVAEFYKADRRIWWAVPLDTETSPSHVIAYGIDPNNEGFSVLKFPFGITSITYGDDPVTGQGIMYIGTPDGAVYEYGEASRFSDSDELFSGTTAIEYIVRSRKYGSESPQIVKRVVELRLTFDLDTQLEGSVLTYKDGQARDSRPMGIHKTGRRTYRRGLDFVGYETSWEFRANRRDQRPKLVSAAVMMTAVGTESNW